MNVLVAVLCDAATDDRGKLNLLGAFDTILAPAFPTVHPQCAVALRLTFNDSDAGDHEMNLRFVDADGHDIMPPSPIEVSVEMPDDATFLSRNFIIHISQLKLRAPGPYSFDVFLDDEPITSVPLLVKHVPENEPTEDD